jgi:hypothetical protein
MVNRFSNLALADEPTRQDSCRNRALTEIPVILEPR